MRRRNRFIAGTLALAAMSFALAETVVAATCAPAMDMPMAEAGAEQAPADPCMSGMTHDREREDRGEDERHCPFGPAAAAQACVGVASLPSYAVDAFAPSPEGGIAVFIEQTEHDLLLEHALFHPPRA